MKRFFWKKVDRFAVEWKISFEVNALRPKPIAADDMKQKKQK